MEVLAARLDQLEAEIQRLNAVNDDLVRRITVLERLVPEARNPEKQGQVTMKGSEVTGPASLDQTWAWISHDATSIGPKAFNGQRSLVEVFLPQQGLLLCVNLQAFSGCAALRAIVIPASVQSIDALAFCSCKSLVTIDFAPGSKLSNLGNSAFQYCENLKSIQIPPLVSRIPSSCLYGCTALDSVRLIGPNLSAIGCDALGYCTNLKVITLPASIVQIEDSVTFRNCTALEGMKFDGVSSLERFGRGCFSDCRKLKEVEFEKCPKLKVIGDLAFAGSKLSSLRLAVTSLVELGASSFKNCVALVEVELPPTLVKIGRDAFAGCVEISTLIFSGTSLVEVGDGAFGDCIKLKQKAPLIIPRSLDFIGDRAFPCAVKRVHEDPSH